MYKLVPTDRIPTEELKLWHTANKEQSFAYVPTDRIPTEELKRGRLRHQIHPNIPSQRTEFRLRN